MNLELVKAAPSLGYATSYVAATAWPALSVGMGFATTHVFLNSRALGIVEADGWREEAMVLRRYLLSLQAGVCWADGGRRFCGHYFNPHTGAGLWHWAPASELCRDYVDRALAQWRRGRRSKAMFLLGVATHLVQDAAEPHHARCRAVDGHGDYEKWVQVRKQNYAASAGGIYRQGCSAAGWVAFNASVAYDYFSQVRSNSSPKQYDRVTAVLLPLAQRTTAGFWVYFLEKAGQSRGLAREVDRAGESGQARSAGWLQPAVAVEDWRPVAALG